MESELSEIEALLIRQVTSFLSYLVIVLFSHQSFAEVANGQLLGLMIVFAAFDMISYLAYYIAINRLQPAKATGLNVSYVVWTVLFAVVFLGAPLDIADNYLRTLSSLLEFILLLKNKGDFV